MATEPSEAVLVSLVGIKLRTITCNGSVAVVSNMWTKRTQEMRIAACMPKRRGYSHVEKAAIITAVET